MKKIDHFHREVKKQFHSSRIKLYSKIQGKNIFIGSLIFGAREHFNDFLKIIIIFFGAKNLIFIFSRDVPGAVLPENDNVTNNNNSPTEENNHFYSNLPEPPPYKR